MKELSKVFNFDGNDVRTVVENGDVWFVAKDVCEVLGLSNPSMALSRLEEDQRSKLNLGRQGEVNIVNESGLYDLVFDSRKPEARKFRKWVTHDVLPVIRKNKVYIDPSATDQEIDHAVRFATPQKRRKALMDSTIDGKESVFAIYEQIKEYMIRWSADDKIKALKHVERTLEDKKDEYGNDIAFVHKIEELLRTVAKDIDKIRNWQNGAAKRRLDRENKMLHERLEEVKQPEIDEYHRIPVHPFSENYMWEPITKKKWIKSEAYKKWIENFPWCDMPDEDELDIDWDKPIKLYLTYDHKAKFDVVNFHKSAIDMIFGYYGYDDKTINELEIVNKTNRYVTDYKDGSIYFFMTN